MVLYSGGAYYSDLGAWFYLCFSNWVSSTFMISTELSQSALLIRPVGLDSGPNKSRIQTPNRDIA